jgi:long-subunit fatty acid transport protein
MKKLILLTTITAFSFAVKAQLTYGPYVSFGVSRAIKTDMSQVSKTKNVLETYRSEGSPTYGLGVDLSYNIGKKMNLMTGIGFQHTASTFKRSTDKLKNDETMWEETYTLDYINIPLVVVYDIYKGFYAGGGFNISYALNSEFSRDGATIYEALENDATKEASLATQLQQKGLSAASYGFMLRGGYKFGPYTVSGDLNFGLNNLNKVDGQKFSQAYFDVHFGYNLCHK